MKTMKRTILVAILAISATVEAQQIPLYSNYFFTPYIYNPARSGTEGFTEATLLHRRQWSGVQGSPETSALAVNGSLNEQKIGWSIYGYADQTDILKRMGIYGNYAYHINLSDNAQLSFGIGAGYLNTTIDIANVNAQQMGDFIGIINDQDRGAFDLNAGVNFKIADFQIGAAAPQLLGQKVEYAETPNTQVNYTLLRHYIFNAQYDFKFAGDKQILSPMVMVRVAENVPFQIDAGLMYNFVEYGYIGAMYRSEYAVTGNIGLNLTEQLTIGYAYDFSLNDFGPDLGTSHEFMLTYRFGSNKRNERLENEIKKLKNQQRQAKDETEEIVDEKLEEFKDEYRKELQEEMNRAAAEAAEKAAKEAAENARNNPGQTGSGNQGGQTGNNQQGGNQGGQTGNQGSGNNAGNQGGQTGGNTGSLPSQVSAGTPGYYLTAGVFSNQSNADRLKRRLQNEGMQVGIFQDPGNSYYYVFLMRYDNIQNAQAAQRSNLNGRYSGETWIKIIQ